MAGGSVNDLQELHFASRHGVLINDNGGYYQRGKSYGLEVKLFVVGGGTVVTVTAGAGGMIVRAVVPAVAAKAGEGIIRAAIAVTAGAEEVIVGVVAAAAGAW